MSTAATVVVTVFITVYAVISLLHEYAKWRGRQGPYTERRRVLVNLDTGRTFSGVLWSRTGEWLVLRNAEMLQRGEAAAPIDGEIVVECARVEFVQAL